MGRFNTQRDVGDQDGPPGHAEPSVLGRDLSPPAMQPGHRPPVSDQPSGNGQRILLPAVAAGFSALAVVFTGMMLFNQRMASYSWLLWSSIFALLAAAAALGRWRQQGAHNHAKRRSSFAERGLSAPGARPSRRQRRPRG